MRRADRQVGGFIKLLMNALKKWWANETGVDEMTNDVLVYLQINEMIR